MGSPEELLHAETLSILRRFLALVLGKIKCLNRLATSLVQANELR